MKTVLETCIPRQSILQGTFNPEIFTAALGPVIQHYKGQTGTIDAISILMCSHVALQTSRTRPLPIRFGTVLPPMPIMFMNA